MSKLHGLATYVVSTLTEETYEELHMLLREALADAPDNRIVIASGDDLFTEQGECLYGN